MRERKVCDTVGKKAPPPLFKQPTGVVHQTNLYPLLPPLIISKLICRMMALAAGFTNSRKPLRLQEYLVL